MTSLAYGTKEEVFDWMYRIQIGRRNLTAIQKVEISLKMKPVYAKMAQEKAIEGNRKGGQASPNKSTPTLGETSEQSNSERHSKETDAQLAKIAGIGKETFRKGAKILESDNEKLKQKVKSGNMSINAA